MGMFIEDVKNSASARMRGRCGAGIFRTTSVFSVAMVSLVLNLADGFVPASVLQKNAVIELRRLRCDAFKGFSRGECCDDSGANGASVKRWTMIHKAQDDGKRKDKRHRHRAPALFFRDTDTTDIVPEMPLELIKLQGAARPQDFPTSLSGQSPSFGESYWMEYKMKILCDVCEKKAEPVKNLKAVESAYLDGRIATFEAYEQEKKEALKEFWASLVSDGATRRNIKAKEINLQVTNSPQFVDSWIKKNILDAGERTIGLAVQWSMRGSKAVQRERISLVQIAVGRSVLIVQMAQVQPPRLPNLLHSVLADERIRKVGSRVLSDALKLQKDWAAKVLGRVDVCERAAILGYCDEQRGTLSDVARSVLAIDYAMPRSVARGDWSVAALTDMQLSCAAMEAWAAREALLYIESLTASEIAADTRVPTSALAVPTVSRASPALAGGSKRARSVRAEEADKVLYLPKVDVRKGGSCAHWIWRGTRVSDQHVAKYCDVEVEVDDGGDATVVRLWGEGEKVEEAAKLVGKLLARSQVESHCLALGMTVPQYIDRPSPDGGVQTTALVNQMELVDWSFFPSRLTKFFPSATFPVRGLGQRHDLLRAAFFAQADAAARVADELLGVHRPGVVVGPLPPGLNPGLMWRISGYSL